MDLRGDEREASADTIYTGVKTVYNDSFEASCLRGEIRYWGDWVAWLDGPIEAEKHNTGLRQTLRKEQTHAKYMMAEASRKLNSLRTHEYLEGSEGSE